jgi:tetratricopeptide (TPR) repeat protein
MMTRLATSLLIVLGVLVGLSLRTVVNCGDADDPDVCSAVIGFSPFRGSMIAFAYEGRGRIAMRHDDYKRAITDFDEALRLNSNRASIFRDRGLAYQKTGAFELAIADYDQAIALDPKVASPYYNRGLALAAEGYLDRAILSYTTAIRLAPSDADARLHRGLAFLARGQVEDAWADFEVVLALPDSPAQQLARAKLGELSATEPTHISAPLR